MNKNKFIEIEQLINENKIEDAQLGLSKMGSSFLDDPEYLYLRGKIFYINKLYYLAIDTLLIALEFEQNDKIYNMIAEIYNILENRELSKSIYNANQREAAIKLLKNELSGMYYKK
jgi:uncharacterized protein HemY|tara:strand:+ start:926 stop:1273 length:348 start_codon:yes stop_codon:yes gene_type:complete